MQKIKIIKIAVIIVIFINYFHAVLQAKKPVFMKWGNSKTKLAGEENGKKIYFTELTGNPVIETDNKELRAEKFIVRGSNGEIAEAQGNVVLTDKVKGSKIKAAKAVYYKEKDIVEFHGKPNAVLKREDDKSTIDIRADMFRYDLNKDTFEADRNVCLKNSDQVISSGNAVYSPGAKTAVFSGDPKITRGEDTYFADRIIYHTDKKLMILDRNARVIAFSGKRDKQTNQLKKERLDAKGDRIEHYNTEEKVTIIKGNAEFENEEFYSKGDEFKSTGAGDNQEITGLNVHLNYKNENTEADGKYFKSHKKDGYSSLWEKASMTFKDKTTGKETSKVFGEYMEYYKDIDEVYVSGKVRVISADGTIKGEIARYNRVTDILKVMGNARIEKGDSIVLSREILINTKNNETRVNGDIRGRGRQ